MQGSAGGGAGTFRLKYSFGRVAAVPAAGTLQLFATGQTTQGFRVIRAGTITAISLKTNVADGVRSYNVQVRVNGIVTAAILAYPSGSISAAVTGLLVAVVPGDIVTVFLVRTAGAGASTFNQHEALVEITE